MGYLYPFYPFYTDRRLKENTVRENTRKDKRFKILIKCLKENSDKFISFRIYVEDGYIYFYYLKTVEGTRKLKKWSIEKINTYTLEHINNIFIKKP